MHTGRAVRYRYKIGADTVDVEGPPAEYFSRGEDICLSSVHNDPSAGAAWYNRGYTVVDYSQSVAHALLHDGVESLVVKAISDVFPTRDLSDFKLENYHKFVSVEEHRCFIDARIKRFYFHDLPFDDRAFISIAHQEIGQPVSYVPRGQSDPHWVIVRIIMPNATSYNPPHKDIYEGFDSSGVCPRMVNAWIPICGVNSGAGLAVAESSHLIKEVDIRRTQAGAVMNGTKFSVNFIRDWGGDNSFTLLAPNEGEMLIFSSHLIHGLGANRNKDTTRVALEFRFHGE